MQNSEKHFDNFKRLAITNSRHLKLNKELKNHFVKTELFQQEDNKHSSNMNI